MTRLWYQPVDNRTEHHELAEKRLAYRTHEARDRLTQSFHRKRGVHGGFRIEKDYEILRVLGKGGFSTVKEARLRGTGGETRTVAIKITSLDTCQRYMGLDRHAVLPRLDRIAKTLNGLNCPNIIRCYGNQVSDTELYTFLEICDGMDLFSRIQAKPKGQLSEDEARRVTRSLLRALRAIHAVGIIHRDVKPENCFYRSLDSHVEEVVLADFGCCIEGGDEDSYYVGAAGSPGYAAPEMIANQAYNSQIDIFSLGVTVYECLTGRTPFYAGDDARACEDALHRPTPFPSQYWRHISVEGRDCVRRMLEKDPRVRWTADELLKHPWISGGENGPMRPVLHTMLSGNSTSSADSLASTVSAMSLAVPRDAVLASEGLACV